MEAFSFSHDKEYPTMVKFDFRPTNNENREIKISEVTTVDLSTLVRNYKTIITESQSYKSMQDSISCQNRIDGIEFNLYQEAGSLKLGMAANIEKHWCSSFSYPCSSGTCRSDQSGKLWGAHIKSDTTFRLAGNSLSNIHIVTSSVNTSSQTSREQDLVVGLFGNATGLGVFGSILTVELENNILRKIEKKLTEVLNGEAFKLPNVGSSTEIPTYYPVIISMEFSEAASIEGLTPGREIRINKYITANIKREVSNYPEATGCFIAKSLDGVHVEEGSPPSEPKGSSSNDDFFGSFIFY
jgi:hypothetical protein